MCAKEAYGVGRLGTESTASRISARSLTAFYRQLLQTAKVEIFYCGSANFTRVESALKGILNELPGSYAQEGLTTDVLLSPHAARTCRYSDVLDVNQGKLSIGFRLGETMKHLNIPATMVFNAVYGGSVTSKLFMNVREKLSLCYYAGSSIDKHKGIMLVNSGVNFEDFGRAQREILKQLKNVANGDISDYELDAARRYVVTSLRSTLDRPFGMEEYYFDASIAGHDLSPDDIADRCAQITKEQVTEIAGNILLDSIYCLKGGEPVGA
jgi:predicted Zn-dependent peptidase